MWTNRDADRAAVMAVLIIVAAFLTMALGIHFRKATKAPAIKPAPTPRVTISTQQPGRADPFPKPATQSK